MKTQTYEQFFRREFPAMVALAAAVSGSRIAAEDIAQEALHRAHSKWEEVSGFDKPDAWIRRVTINLSIGVRRKAVSELRAKSRMAGEPTMGPPSEPDDVVWQAVAKLPKKQRAAVSLFYLEDRSTDEIATILECSPSTARVHLHKARANLAKLLGGQR